MDNQRLQIHLTVEQKDWLRKRAYETGLSISEIIRRLIDKARA